MEFRPTSVGDVLSGSVIIHLSCAACGAYAEIPADGFCAGADAETPLEAVAIACPVCADPDPTLILVAADALIEGPDADG